MKTLQDLQAFLESRNHSVQGSKRMQSRFRDNDMELVVEIGEVWVEVTNMGDRGFYVSIHSLDNQIVNRIGCERFKTIEEVRQFVSDRSFVFANAISRVGSFFQ